MCCASTLARLFARASVAVLTTFLPQAGIAQAASTSPPLLSCSGTAVAGACAHQQPSSGRVDVVLMGPAGTRAVSGVCPVSKPQSLPVRPPVTVVSYVNRSQCSITVVDDQGKRHTLLVGKGEFPGGLVIVEIIIDPVDFSGRP